MRITPVVPMCSLSTVPSRRACPTMSMIWVNPIHCVPNCKQIKRSAMDMTTSGAITALHRLAVSTDPPAIRALPRTGDRPGSFAIFG